MKGIAASTAFSCVWPRGYPSLQSCQTDSGSQ